MLNDALHAQTPQLVVCASPGIHQSDDTTAPSTPMAVVPAVQPATVCASPGNLQSGDTSTQLPPVADVPVVQPAARTAASVASFIDSLKLPLEEPLVCTPPRARTAKNVDDDWIPGHSDRLAAKSAFRDPQPEKQARRVLLNKWAGHPDNMATGTPDDSIASQFHEAFGGSVSTSKRAALRELFPMRGARWARTVARLEL